MRTHATIQDRHDIMALIKRRYGSAKAMSEQCGISRAKISAALGAPYPEVERQIATALNQSVPALWPDRYWPNGRRRSSTIRAQQSDASQNARPPVDGGAAE